MYSIFIGASIGSIPELINRMLKAIGASERLMDIQEAEAPEPVSLAGKAKGEPPFSKEVRALRARLLPLRHTADIPCCRT
jgi:hypothetical protein